MVATQKTLDSLKAIGLNKNEIQGSLRLVLNEDINEKDIQHTLKEIENSLNILKKS